MMSSFPRRGHRVVQRAASISWFLTLTLSPDSLGHRACHRISASALSDGKGGQRWILKWDFNSPWASMNSELICPRWQWTETRRTLLGINHHCPIQRNDCVLTTCSKHEGQWHLQKSFSCIPKWKFLDIRREDEICLGVNPIVQYYQLGYVFQGLVWQAL